MGRVYPDSSPRSPRTRRSVCSARAASASPRSSTPSPASVARGLRRARGSSGRETFRAAIPRRTSSSTSSPGDPSSPTSRGSGSSSSGPTRQASMRPSLRSRHSPGSVASTTAPTTVSPAAVFRTPSPRVELPLERYERYLDLQREIAYLNRRRDQRAQQEEEMKWKKIAQRIRDYKKIHRKTE
jgi:hypothetical protein